MKPICDNIFRLVIPYKDIFTTVYLVKTEQGALVFDAASFDSDIDGYIVPFLEELGITPAMLKYVFISHNHIDHAGGLSAFMKKYPETCIVSRSPALKEKFDAYSVLAPEDNDSLLDVLKVVTIPGHTMDAAGILDTRTNTLISGDSLQLYGIYGSGKWAANITLPQLHFDAIEKLRGMEISRILTAHDYHPCGYDYKGKTEISRALDSCIEPLVMVKDLILQNPELDDEQIAALFNQSQTLPTLGERVVAAMRELIKNG